MFLRLQIPLILISSLRLNWRIIIFSFFLRLWLLNVIPLKRFNFKVICKPINKFNSPSTKSSIPEFRKWGICKVPCKDCNLFYIGQTKRSLETRLSKHLRCVTNQEIYKSSIAKHCWSTGYDFNFHQAKIILKPNRMSELDFP